MGEAHWTEERLEYVACDYCGGEDFREVTVRPDGLRVVECWRCGLAFVDPRPREQFIKRLYDETYFTDCGGSGRDYLEVKVVSLQTGTCPNLEFARRFTGFKDKRVLDVGCAYGTFLHLLRELGAQVEGVDISEHAADKARELFGLKVYVGTIEDLPVPEGSFDIVNCSHTMEHVRSPSSFAERLVSLMAEDGFLFLGVPNYECERFCGSRWRGFYPPDLEHLYYFTADFLLRLFGRLGLSRVAVETTPLCSGSFVCSGDKTQGVSLRTMTKNALSALRLVGLARGLLAPFHRPKFTPFGNDHFLYVAMRKSQARRGGA